MTLIVDASVALKWFLDEDDRASALALLRQGALSAPDFLLLECANTFTFKVRQRFMQPETARRSLAALKSDLGVRLWPSEPYITAAHEIALELQRSAYDSRYLALAIARQTRVVTADVKFAKAVKASPAYVPFLCLLSDAGAALEI